LLVIAPHVPTGKPQDRVWLGGARVRPRALERHQSAHTTKRPGPPFVDPWNPPKGHQLS